MSKFIFAQKIVDCQFFSSAIHVVIIRDALILPANFLKY